MKGVSNVVREFSKPHHSRRERGSKMKKSKGNVWVITLVQLAMLLLVWGLVLPTTDALAKHIKSPGTWTPPCGTPGGLACLLEGREGAATTVVDNEIIVSHGFSAFGGDSNDTRIYDIDADTWSNPAPVPPACVRSELAGAAHGDLHYAVGGRGVCPPFFGV